MAKKSKMGEILDEDLDSSLFEETLEEIRIQEDSEELNKTIEKELKKTPSIKEELKEEKESRKKEVLPAVILVNLATFRATAKTIKILRKFSNVTPLEAEAALAAAYNVLVENSKVLAELGIRDIALETLEEILDDALGIQWRKRWKRKTW